MPYKRHKSLHVLLVLKNACIKIFFRLYAAAFFTPYAHRAPLLCTQQNHKRKIAKLCSHKQHLLALAALIHLQKPFAHVCTGSFLVNMLSKPSLLAFAGAAENPAKRPIWRPRAAHICFWESLLPAQLFFILHRCVICHIIDDYLPHPPLHILTVFMHFCQSFC